MLACAAVAAVVAGAGMPATASAEGGWNSFLSGVANGYGSRAWTDFNRDGAWTTVTLSGCKRHDGAAFRLEVELIKDRPWPQSDLSLGRRDVSRCTVARPTVNWGNPGAGTYYFRFWHHDFGLISAAEVKATY